MRLEFHERIDSQLAHRRRDLPLRFTLCESRSVGVHCTKMKFFDLAVLARGRVDPRGREGRVDARSRVDARGRVDAEGIVINTFDRRSNSISICG